MFTAGILENSNVVLNIAKTTKKERERERKEERER